MAAAAEILERDGYAGLVMERVATESGVAKTTLYRSWPTKAALCMDLYMNIAGRELEQPDTGTLRGDLRQIIDAVVQLQTRTPAGAAFIGLLSEAQLNPATRPALLAEFAERRREVTRIVLRRAIQRGEIRADTNIDVFIDALGGAVTFRLLQGHAPLNARFSKSLIELLLHGCLVETE